MSDVCKIVLCTTLDANVRWFDHGCLSMHAYLMVTFGAAFVICAPTTLRALSSNITGSAHASMFMINFPICPFYRISFPTVSADSQRKRKGARDFDRLERFPRDFLFSEMERRSPMPPERGGIGGAGRGENEATASKRPASLGDLLFLTSTLRP